jgi:hypothetical protein
LSFKVGDGGRDDAKAQSPRKGGYRLAAAGRSLLIQGGANDRLFDESEPSALSAHSMDYEQDDFQ